MPTKKIRLLDPTLTVTLISGTKVTLQAGRVYDIDKELAKKLIEAGHVVEVVEEHADATASEKPNENQDA